MEWQGSSLVIIGCGWLLCCGFTGLAEPVDRSQQEKWEYRGEVFGTVGAGKFWHGDENLGKGLDVGAGVGFRPFTGKLRGLGFEFRVNRLDHEMGTGGAFSVDGHLTGLAGHVLYHFGPGKIQPFVNFGVGQVIADYTVRGLSEWYDAGGNFHSEERIERVDDSKLGINLGIGIKFALNQKFSIRPELNIVDTTPGEGYNWAALRLLVGIGYHW